MSAAAPEDALVVLAAQLRDEATVISPHVDEPRGSPELGVLAGAGPRAAAAPGEYALVVETVREGYLLHYGEPRLLAGHDPDLALLAGDYLYALGIERLAGLGDTEAVAELADLISLSAQCHAEDRGEIAPALWLAGAVAVGCGADAGLRSAKEAAREMRPDAAPLLRDAAAARARECGAAAPFERIGESIDFRGARQA
jgi:hypothetical protein